MHVETIMLKMRVILFCFMASPFSIYQFDAAERTLHPEPDFRRSGASDG
jgi:hypothetical protein